MRPVLKLVVVLAVANSLVVGLAVAGCEAGGPAIVSVRCGEDEATAWATPIELTDDGWGSYLITSADVVEECVTGEPVSFAADAVIRYEIDLVEVRAGSATLVGHVYNVEAIDGLASVVVREHLDFLYGGYPPNVGDSVRIVRVDGSMREAGSLTRADREALVTSVPLEPRDRGSPMVDTDGDAIGTVVLHHGRLRGAPLVSLCRSVLDCAEYPIWPDWP